jgi:hypothetical protein
MPSGIKIYCGCIERVRYHARDADIVFAGKIDT